MIIEYIIKLITGLCLFLFGMNLLTGGLKTLSRDRFNKLIKNTDNLVKGTILGTLITMIVQSSSFVTVILVSLVDANIINLYNSVGIIMGSNIGTCITAWLLSLMTFKTSNTLLGILNPMNLVGIVSLLGIILLFKNKKNKAYTLFGFTILIIGMELMTTSLLPFSTSNTFNNILYYFSNPFLGLLLGIVLTVIFQSSSLIIGLLESIAITTKLPFLSSLVIIIGSNIGTCSTTIISSIKTNRTAKQVGIIHLIFNIIGGTIFLVLFYFVNNVFNLSFTNSYVDSFDIALIHTVFNVFSTIILLPFTKLLISISEKLVK